MIRFFQSFSAYLAMSGVFGALLMGCARTEIIDSPKTAYVSDAEEAKEPSLIWTSRTLTQPFDYLGQVKVRSLSYDKAIGRLIDAGRTMKADALIDIHYEEVGFLSTLHAFAVKYKR